MGDQANIDPVVGEKTLDLKLKVLEQRLTIKLIAGLVATQAIPHLSLPGSVTAGVFLAAIYKSALVLVTR